MDVLFVISVGCVCVFGGRMWCVSCMLRDSFYCVVVVVCVCSVFLWCLLV